MPHYDLPQLAAESAGDRFGGTEIDFLSSMGRGQG